MPLQRLCRQIARINFIHLLRNTNNILFFYNELEIIFSFENVGKEKKESG